MFRNNITVDQMSNFISLEKTKLLELKKEYDKKDLTWNSSPKFNKECIAWKDKNYTFE